jgi:hypothetical protein
LTAQHRDREPGAAASPRRAPSPPPEDDIAAGTASRAGPDSHSGLVSSVDEAARLTNPSCDQLYGQMHLGVLDHVKVYKRCLITRHLKQLLGIAS